MFVEYLLSVPKANDLTFADDARPPFLVRIGEDGDNWIYLLHYETDPMLEPEFVQATCLGCWDFDGQLVLDGNGDPTYPVHADFERIRPFGNADDGSATDALQYTYGAGWGQRWMTKTSLYPAGNQPIILTIERVWDDTPGWEGWGWTATIDHEDPNRAATARAVLVDMVDNVGSGPYTTGAFVLTQVGVDDESNPIMKYQTKNPASRVSDDPQDIHVSMMFGAQVEGKFTLPADQTIVTRQFWQAGQTQPGQTWQDSGATVTGMAGTVTKVSDMGPFSIGLQVRIDGHESEVTGLHAQGLILTPYKAHTTGATVEVFI